MSSVMPTLTVEGVRRVAWTPDAVEHAKVAGLLDSSERFEIIDGELYSKKGQGWPHSFAVDALLIAIGGLDASQFSWSCQTPIQIGPSYPEPDFRVMRGPLAKRTKPAGIEEAVLVIEVSDSSMAFDVRVKVPLYAGAAVPVLWLLDLNRQQMVVYSEPTEGAFTTVETYLLGDVVPPAFPGAPSVAVSSLIAPDFP